jgi:hypothetical protein
VPEVPEIPEVPEVPEIPEVPEVPEIPEVPEVPEIPEVPEVPEDEPLLWKVFLSSGPFLAKAGVEIAKLPTSKKANSLCLVVIVSPSNSSCLKK